LSLSGAANNFKVTYPGDQMGSFQFSGYVSSFSYDTPVLGLLKGKVDILVNGALLDDAANLLSVVVTDANAPNYTTGETLELTATFDEIVNVTGVPKIAVALTSGTVYANYASGTDTNVLKFSHVIGSGDASEAGTMTVGTLGLNGGSILDFGGNVAVVTFVAPTTTTFSVNHSA
jgi:hypothetical protein